MGLLQKLKPVALASVVGMSSLSLSGCMSPEQVAEYNRQFAERQQLIQSINDYRARFSPPNGNWMKFEHVITKFTSPIVYVEDRGRLMIQASNDFNENVPIRIQYGVWNAQGQRLTFRITREGKSHDDNRIISDPQELRFYEWKEGLVAGDYYYEFYINGKGVGGAPIRVKANSLRN